MIEEDGSESLCFVMDAPDNNDGNKPRNSVCKATGSNASLKKDRTVTIITREASCSCGKLSIRATGAPVKISACHCRECQRRTGSAFGVAVFFEREKISASGASTSYSRSGDSGRSIEFRFCSDCGSTVFWMPEFREDLVAVALGCFNDPSSLVPTQSVYEESRVSWVGLDLRSGD